MMPKVVCDIQVPEAQQQQRDHLQSVHGAVTNGVEDVLHHTEVAVATGDTLHRLSLLIWYPMC